MQEWIGYLVSAIASGSLAWLATIKWTRKQAEADAMESVQNVYQELIEDLKKDREELKDENQKLRMEIKELHDRIATVEGQCRENARKVEAMRPFICTVQNCPKRQTHIDL